MLPAPPDIDPGPFEPAEAGDNRATLITVLSAFAAGLVACVIAFALLR